MKTFVLIHGAWHGNWCYDIVVDKLRSLGHRVYALDLPGHHNNTNVCEFSAIDLRAYVDFVKDFILSLRNSSMVPLSSYSWPLHEVCQDRNNHNNDHNDEGGGVNHGNDNDNRQDRKIVLVGHSMAGVVISQVAEEMPDKIAHLIYISAFIPDYNGSLIQEENRALKPSVSLEVLIDERRNKLMLNHSRKLKELFYGMCSPQIAESAIAKLQDQPMRPFIGHVSLSDQNFGSVKKRYIECLHDLAIHIEDQRRMNAKVLCERVAINADHSPFFSCPDDLVKALVCESRAIMV